MIAVFGGLAAGLFWSASGLCAQRAGRRMGEFAAFAWGSIVGVLIATTPAIISVAQSPPTWSTTLSLGIGGVLNVVGLLCAFSALRRGRVSVVVPITSGEGAIAGLLAVINGTASLGTVGWIAFTALIAGIVITTVSQLTSADPADSAQSMTTVGIAILAAVAFGAGLFFQGHAAIHASLGLAIVPPSLAGTVLVALPLATRHRGRLATSGLPWAIGVGVAELAGFACYVVGARHSLPVAAVLSTQYATLSVAFGVVVLRERFTRGQLLGFVLTIVGASLLSVFS